MAPSTDEFLHYIYVNSSAVSLLLILVNTVILSAALLLSCSFCKRIWKNELDLKENDKQTPPPELLKVTVRPNNDSLESNGTKHEVTPTGGDVNAERIDKEIDISETTKPQNGESLNHRALPLPLENHPLPSENHQSQTLPLPPQNLPLPPQNHPSQKIPLPPQNLLLPPENHPLRSKNHQSQKLPLPSQNLPLPPQNHPSQKTPLPPQNLLLPPENHPLPSENHPSQKIPLPSQNLPLPSQNLPLPSENHQSQKLPLPPQNLPLPPQNHPSQNLPLPPQNHPSQNLPLPPQNHPSQKLPLPPQNHPSQKIPFPLQNHPSQKIPLPPQNHPATLPKPEDKAPLYNVSEVKLRQELDHNQINIGADEQNKDINSKTIRPKAPGNSDLHESQTEFLEHRNPIYDSVSEMNGLPPMQSDLPSPETGKKDEDSKTLKSKFTKANDSEPPYSVVRRDKKTVKKSPEQNIGNQGNSTENSTVERNNDNQTAHSIRVLQEQPPTSPDPLDKVNSVLTRTKQRSLKFNEKPKSVCISQDDEEEAPPVPAKCFNFIESEIQQQTTEGETEPANQITD
ncbi:uncharacterized protein LOC142142602 [Mixophyes fleayi]|uniref:uncharacterized protein LOC142142602 n=1 Tax=Mixophyes fleayi TaxID=3061075 RepID=UPI003F4E209C